MFVRGFSLVMYLYQAPDGFILGEKWDYKLVLRESGEGRGVPLVISTPLYEGSSLSERSDHCQVDESDSCLAAWSLDAGGG